MTGLLERIARLRILVVGDAMLDHYVFGDASRLSPEAPVPVIEVERDHWTAGGAGNVAINLAALGVQVELLGALGTDEGGTRLRDLLARHGVTCPPCSFLPNVPTIVKTRIVARQQQVCRLDREAAPPVYRLPLAELGAFLTGRIAATDAVIVSDYAKGTVDDALLQMVRQAARQHGKLAACDPKPKREVDYSGFDLLTPNRAESLAMAGLSAHGWETYPAAEACRRIHERYGPGLLIVTLGNEGMLISQGGAVQMRLPTFAREVFDVSGAGDTAIATLTASLAAGAGPEESARLANMAAGVVVGKAGTATATPAEILHHATLV